MKHQTTIAALAAMTLLLGGSLLIAACGSDDDTAEVSIRGVDFGFEGVPASVPAGTNRITFDNGGNELHEVVIFRLPDGMSLAEALELPDEESDEFFYSGLVGTLYAQPGEAAAASLTATLSPGTYGLICFIENAEGPHAFQGMHAELVASP